MKAYVLIIPVLLWSCSPKVVTTPVKDRPPVIQPYESFVLIEKDTIAFNQNYYLGKVEIKDQGLVVNCDYETVKGLAKTEAIKMGGNCLVITEHKLPNVWTSTCHRIKGSVYRIDNPEDYEKEIIWDARRKLKIIDFKGATEKRPFQAGTASTFRYMVRGKPLGKSFKVMAETYFICDLSYFKSSQQDSMVLAHEQLHFDITEIYARKFIQKIGQEITDYQQYLAKIEGIAGQFGRDLQLKQDEYDSEVYADPALQSKWDDWVERELAELEAYREKVVVISR